MRRLSHALTHVSRLILSSVDILGNVGMMEDFLRIVTDFESEEITEDRIASNIRELAQKINAHPQGGVFKKKKK